MTQPRDPMDALRTKARGSVDTLRYGWRVPAGIGPNEGVTLLAVIVDYIVALENESAELRATVARQAELLEEARLLFDYREQDRLGPAQWNDRLDAWHRNVRSAFGPRLVASGDEAARKETP